MRGLLAGLAALFAALPAWAGIDAWTSVPGPGGSNGAIVNVLAASPTNASTRYAATQSGFYVSRDSGQSWQLSNSGIVPTPAGYFIVSDLAVTASTLYIAPTFLQKSSDGASSWARTGWVSENPQALVLAVDAKSPNTVYAGANQGVFKSSDGGATWKYLAGNSPVYALAIDPGNPQVLFRGVASGIYRTSDGGSSWSQVSTQLTSAKTIVVDPKNSMNVYVGTNGAGVWKSTDGGTTFKAINRCIPQGRCAPLTMDGSWVRSIVVDTGNPSIVYLGAMEGLYKSTDGGANWSQANNGPIGVTTMMLDPVNRDTIIANYAGRLYSYTFGAPSDWDRIFNWAEVAYPQFFGPAGAQTQAVAGYQARYYSATKTYLGALNGNVYVYGEVFGGMLFVGTTADLLPLAAAAGY
ncbi:hypothetical protein HLB44_33150 [Aquincola sp. S2]|uniref:Sortilin N-terminal domain-containing protein n=1 Tax=Pseudaquabacterium terrae TaxID=2732868 RepID=A0ABX2ETM4_9BURK|nr:hypothetical protein [Aquabacterium terrae]NRF71845.1 hypothetical protein [Aquabacterium terrae]